MARKPGQSALADAFGALAGLAALGAASGLGGRPGAVKAALLTRMVIGPSAARASCTRRGMSSRSNRSAAIATARPPAASMAATVSPMVPGSRSSHCC